MELQANRLVYPEGNGFRYETGGMMEALRVLKAERIRQFHRDMYQPKNLRLCITGQIEHLELLDILEKFEDSIIHDVPSMDEHFTRPWVDSKRTPPLKESIVESVEFPEEDESSGEISVCLFGPDCYDEVESRALDIMLSYMAGSSISFLENTIVEKEQLASAITYYTENRPNILIWFNLSSVDTENLASVEKRIFDVLKDASSKPLDMEYLHDCLHRLKRQIIHGAETTLGIFSDSIIQDHLFGDRKGKNLHDGLASLDGYRVLETWSETQWRDFLVKYFVENPHVSILGVPSTKLSESITADEAARVKKQQDDLGEEGLKKLAKELEEAKAHNDRPIPDAVLESFVTPGPESIPFIHTTTARSGLAKDMGHLENDIQTLIDKDCKDLPLFIHFEHIPAKCVYFSLILSTGAVPLQLKPLLSVYFDNFFTTPIERNGKRMEFENAVKELERDTINYEIDSGGDISNPELIRIKFSVEPEKYAVAIGWLRDLLFSSIFDVERLDSSVSKLFSEIPSLKRDGSDMAGSVDNMVHWAPESSSRAQNTLVKALYLKRIKHLLKSSPQSVIELLETLRKSLLTFSNMRVVVSGDVTGLNGPVSSWQPLVQGLDTKEPLTPLVARKTVLSDAARNPGKLAYIVPMSTSDSSFGYLTGRGVEGFDNPRLPALMVAAAYLDSVEGPLWTAVRGTGLAYGSNFSYSSATGTISFSIYRSPDAFKAYEAARDVVTAYADGSIPFDKFTLQGAVSSIVVQFANEQTTTVKAALVSFINQVVLGVPKDYGSRILKKVREVGPKEIRAVLKDIVLPVFMPGKADLTVTCASIMTEVSHLFAVYHDVPSDAIAIYLHITMIGS